MSATITRDAEGTVTGNTYDKYGSTNPVVRRLMATFQRTLGELFERVDPESVLDVGCGEAILTHQWATARPATRVVGFDLEDPAIQAEWEKRRAPNLEYRVMKAENLPFDDGEFDLACAIEVLEHVPDPEHTVAEMARVSSGHLLVSVPRERPAVREHALAAADVEHRRRVDALEQLPERALEACHQAPDDRIRRAVLVVRVAGDGPLGVARDRRAHSFTASRSSVVPCPPACAPVVGWRPLSGVPGS